MTESALARGTSIFRVAGETLFASNSLDDFRIPHRQLKHLIPDGLIVEDMAGSVLTLPNGHINDALLSRSA